MYSALLSPKEITQSQEHLEMDRLILEFQAADQSYAIPARLIHRVLEFNPTRTSDSEHSWAHFNYRTDHGVLPVVSFGQAANISHHESTTKKPSIILFQPSTDQLDSHWGLLVDTLHSTALVGELREGEVPKGLNGSTRLVTATAVVGGRELPVLQDPSIFLQ